MNKLAAEPAHSWTGFSYDDGLATLLQTEAVLPAQFWSGSVAGRDEPERRLLLAILEDALITLVQHRGRPDLASRRLVNETEKWIASDRRATAFDFAGLCDVLEIDPAYIRGLLRRPPRRLGWRQRRRSHAGRGHHKVRTSAHHRR